MSAWATRRTNPCFLVTIDTEGDNLWGKPREIQTRNARFLPRFQALAEKYNLRPTYLTNYEMALSREFVELGRDVIARGAGEVGMHLHAWNTPPLVPLTDDDFAHQPYLIEYSEPLMRAKVRTMTQLLEDVFKVEIVSHRAGRWAIDERYIRILAEANYRVDCSVTPTVSWRPYLGDPKGKGGSDYSKAPEQTHFLYAEHDGAEYRLLEVPMTIRTEPMNPLLRLSSRALHIRPLRRLFRTRWLRPRGKNKGEMLSLIREAVVEKRDHIEFMIHSSELMPGGSPTFPTERDIEALHADLENVFEVGTRHFQGVTLREYAAQFA